MKLLTSKGESLETASAFGIAAHPFDVLHAARVTDSQWADELLD